MNEGVELANMCASVCVGGRGGIFSHINMGRLRVLRRVCGGVSVHPELIPRNEWVGIASRFAGSSDLHN